MSSYNKEINIGVIFPSRGLLFTETFKELLEELRGIPHTIYWAHGKKLPACFNSPLKKALNGSHTHILIVEDDMVLKPGILLELLEADKDVIACDYPLTEYPSGTILYDSNGEAIFTGTGFMLIKRELLNKLPMPIFKSNISWEYKHYGDKMKFVARLENPDKVYGQHDITFGLHQYLNGEPIAVAKTVLSQRKLKQKGTNDSNKGTDEIIVLDKYKKISSYILPNEGSASDLLVEITLDGDRMNVTADHAKRLLDAGKATSPTIIKNDIIVDTNNIAKVIKALRRA